MKHTTEYQAILEFYGDRCAKRSGVRLMNHIDEGLVVLNAIGADMDARKAFCLHPLFQADDELMTVGMRYATTSGVDPLPIVLAMEYRHWANAWLADKVQLIRLRRSNGSVLVTDQVEYTGMPSPGPVLQVGHMLIADKVQNYKDFLRHHAKTHDRRDELNLYFQAWLDVLDIDMDRRHELWRLIDLAKV